MPHDPILASFALAAASAATVTDLRRRRIYNGLTLPLLALGPAAQGTLHGLSGVCSSLTGVLSIACVLFLASRLAGPGLGGGDIKLLIGLGALIGWPSSLWLLLYAGLGGLAMATPLMLWRRRFWATWRDMGLYLLRRQLGAEDLSVASASRGPRLPYAACILIGTAAVVTIGPLL